MSQIAGFRGVVAADAPAPSAPAAAVAAAPGAPVIGAGASSGVAPGTMPAGTPMPFGVPIVEAALPRDPTRAVYRYHQAFPGPGGRTLVRKSLICAIQLVPWTDGAVRGHEEPPADATAAALARIEAASAHADPVVAGFHDPANEVERLLRRTEGGTPVASRTTADGVVHTLWRMADAEVLGKLRHNFSPKPLYLLDGHERYAAMLAHQAALGARQPLAPYASPNFGLACLVNLDDPTLVVAPRHRVVRGAGIAASELLAQLAGPFVIDKLPGAAADLATMLGALRETVAHQPVFVLAFAGEPDAWKLSLKHDASAAGTAAGKQLDRALHKLEPVVLQHLILARLATGAQAVTEVDAAAALAALGAGADLVVLARPVPLQTLLQLADGGHRLPAGSSAVYPPIAPGMVSLPIDPDEDLV